MRTYFSHSRIADVNGHFEGDIWLDICLSLLEYIEADGANIPYEKIRKMTSGTLEALLDRMLSMITYPRRNRGKTALVSTRNSTDARFTSARWSVSITLSVYTELATGGNKNVRADIIVLRMKNGYLCQ